MSWHLALRLSGLYFISVKKTTQKVTLVRALECSNSGVVEVLVDLELDVLGDESDEIEAHVALVLRDFDRVHV